MNLLNLKYNEANEQRNPLNNDKHSELKNSSYIPSDDEEYMNKKQISFFKNLLQTWKDNLIESSRRILNEISEKRLDENENIDRAIVETDTYNKMREGERFRKLIERINAALKRIDDGIYGYCTDTGEKIGIQRLLARPIATLCISAQEKHEKFEKSHNNKLPMQFKNLEREESLEE